MKTNFLGFALSLTLAMGPVAAAEEKKTEEKKDAVAEAVTEAARRLDAFQVKEARKALEPVAEQGKGDASYLLTMSRLLELEKKPDEALAAAQKAAEMVPSSADTQNALGEMYLRANKTKEAEEVFKRAEEAAKAAIEADAKNTEAILGLAIAQQRTKNFEEAKKNLDKFLEGNPGDIRGLYRQGLNASFQQKWKEAVDWFTKAIEKDASYAYAYYYRGLAQEKAGKKDQLVLDMDRFVKLAPDAPEASRAKSIIAAAKR